MRALPLALFATEAAVPAELVERLVGVGAIARLPDGRYDSRDEQVASTAQAVIDAGIPFDALAWALTEGRFGLRSLGLIFSAGEVIVEEGVVVALPRGTARFEPIGRVELKDFLRQSPCGARTG
jgi:hypothetical protein